MARRRRVFALRGVSQFRRQNRVPVTEARLQTHSSTYGNMVTFNGSSLMSIVFVHDPCSADEDVE